MVHLFDKGNQLQSCWYECVNMCVILLLKVFKYAEITLETNCYELQKLN